MSTDATSEQWLSQAAFDRLQQEYERLTTEGRRDVTEQIKRAREHGDLSENADYDAAKDRQGLMEARIRELEMILKNARVLEPSDQEASTVTPGMIVKIRRESTGGEEEYLVGSAENRGEGVDVVSPSSPLGGALVGHAVGDTVSYEAPAGTMTVTILAIRGYGG